MEFREWPKTARLLNKPVTVTEKIDGTNAAIHFEPDDGQIDLFAFATVEDRYDGPEGPARVKQYRVGAQSRKRLITPESDNYGFARWVQENAQTLFDDLGPGLHFGEWWGNGIQRRYGLGHKKFSLFNTAKWGAHWSVFKTPRLDVVPVLYEGPFIESVIREVAEELRTKGSVAAPGFKDPEGVCIYHSSTRLITKFTFDGDGHKGNGDPE